MTNKQITLLLALASATCTFNHPSAAAQEEKAKTEQVTTSKSSTKAIAYKASLFVGAMILSGVFDTYLGAPSQGLFAEKLGQNLSYAGHFIVLGVLSLAAAFGEAWFCGCDKEEKGKYDLYINAGFYFVIMSLGTCICRYVYLHGASSDEASDGVLSIPLLYGEVGSLTRKTITLTMRFIAHGAQLFLMSIAAGVHAFMYNYFCASPEKSKSDKSK